jgi:hypothetical protein
MRRQLPIILGAAPAFVLTGAFSTAQAQTPTPSASSTLTTQALSSRTVSFGVGATGITKPVTWGLDAANPSVTNVRRGKAFMGRVDIARVSFQPTLPLVNGDLQQRQIDDLNYRLWLASLTGASVVTINCDHPYVNGVSTVDPWYVNNPARWAQLIDVTTQRVQAAGRTVATVAPYNEPDWGHGQFPGPNGTNTNPTWMKIFSDTDILLRANPRFSNIRISGPNTLSTNQVMPWYNYLKPTLDEGNTHQLGGTFDLFATFFQTVRADGKYASDDEMHNVMEAMVGYEYGLQAGIWWSAAELARGEFCNASRGQRLGYAEHRPNWTAASVYRGLDGRVLAFGGNSERNAVNTTYRFISKERDVYYDGVGPQREFALTMPGGNGYEINQPNAERVINVTWGEDVQPAIAGRYLLVNRSTGKTLQVAGGSTTTGATMQQDTYTGATSQQFDVQPVRARVGGDFSYVSIEAAHSGKTLAVPGNSLVDGTVLVQGDTTNATKTQQWYLDYAGDGWFYVRNRWAAKCLDIAANGLDVMHQNKVANDQTQQWRLLPVGAPIEFVAPGAPTGLVATARAESVRLSWAASPATDVAGYDVLRAETAGGPFNTIARRVVGTAFVDNTATTAGTYVYKVRAVDNSLNRSTFSNQATATTTGTAELVAQLRFDGNTLDSTPNLNHSAAAPGTSYVAGKVGANSLLLNGTTGFVQLPSTVANHAEITIATWVYWNGGANWQRLFDFGNDEAQNMYLSPKSATNTLSFGIRTGGVRQTMEAPALPVGVWSHVAITLGTGGGRMYVNGQQVAQSTTMTLRPTDLMPVANYIGRSQFADPLLNGRVDDFSIYNYVLTPAQVASLAQSSTTWTGTTSTDWNTATNWTAGVPTADMDAILPASAVRSPLIASGMAAARGLTIGGPVTQTGGTLDVRGDLTNNGTFTATGGTVRLGVAGQAGGPRLLGSSPTRFWNLEVLADGATMGAPAGASVQRVLTLTGSLATQGNPLTLESNATGTGMVVSNGGAVVGNATVQRYVEPELNPGTGYRHFTAAVTGATVADLGTAGFTPVVNPAYNSSATPGATTPFPTVLGYDQSRLTTATSNYSDFDKGWFSPAALSDVLAEGQGYALQTTAGQTISLTGSLNDGPLVQTLTSAAGTADGGWQLLGNPYPSPLDYSLVTAADRAGLDAAIYVFESTGPYAGTYRSYANGVGGDPVLALGQAFFARVSAGQPTGTLTLRNEQRVTSYQNPTYHRAAPDARPLVQLTLQGSGPLTDHAYVYFEAGATDAFDPQFDALKLPNSSGLNLSARLGSQQLSIDGHGVLGTTPRVVPLAVGVPTSGAYTLTASQLRNLGAVPTYLRDLQTNALVDLAQQPSYSFTVGNAAAPLTGRFELLFSPQKTLATAPAALAQQVSLYPNPATGSAQLELRASLGSQAVTATLVDAVGREVRTLSLPARAGVHTLDLRTLPAGIYALRLATSAGTIVKKLTVQ